MSLLSTLHFINSHPLGSKSKLRAYFNLLNWQLDQGLAKRKVVKPFIENAVLYAKKGMTGATGNIYVGLHEFEEMAFLLHFLKKEDTFFDVGANIGSYTILASKIIGAKSVSFEPSPSTYNHLLDNVKYNTITELVTTENLGISDSQKKLFFTDGLDTINHVTSKDSGGIEVSTTSLDLYCEEYHAIPSILKIDVEGFETEVINGAKSLLSNPILRVVIMELNGSGNRYGFDEESIHQKMLENNFKAYTYEPFTRELTLRATKSKHGNTIYIKDLDKCYARLNAARKFKALGIQF